MNCEEKNAYNASVYAEFEECKSVEKYVKLFDFKHFQNFFRFDYDSSKRRRKTLSDGVYVSVVLDVESGNIR